MPVAVVFSPAAESDLNDIWLDIAQESLAAADRFVDSVGQRSEQLSEFPELGRLRPEISDTARSLNVGNYLILYRLAARAVEVIRVVHGARDLTALL